MDGREDGVAVHKVFEKHIDEVIAEDGSEITRSESKENKNCVCCRHVHDSCVSGSYHYE